MLWIASVHVQVLTTGHRLLAIREIAVKFMFLGHQTPLSWEASCPVVCSAGHIAVEVDV